MLILNDPPGMLERMVKSAPHDEEDPMPAFGKEIEDVAKVLAGPE